MMPAQIIVEIVEGGGEIRLEDGRLKVKGIPARLIPAIREHKAEVLALLSTPAPDDYDSEERAAIMEHDGGLPREEAERLAGIVPAEPQPAPEGYERTTRCPSWGVYGPANGIGDLQGVPALHP